MATPLREAWLAHHGDYWARQYLVEYDPTPANDHLNYDGIECTRRMSELMAARDAEVSALLFTAAEDMMDDMWAHQNMQSDPMTMPPDGTVNGYFNYNMGPRAMVDDVRSNPSLLANYSRIACNFARGSAFCRQYIIWGMEARSRGFTFPYNDGDNRWDPALPPSNSRNFALGILSQMVADDIYDVNEDRTFYGYTSYPQGVGWYITDMLGRWFFQYNMDTGEDLPYIACVDQWRNIDQDIQDVGGDLTLIPESWATSPKSFSPWNFAHVSRMLIHAYDSPLIVNHPYGGTMRAKMRQAVIDFCDISLRWFQQDTVGGRPCLIYRILDLGVMPNAAPDLGLWYMPMFAWAYKMTGVQTYYDWAEWLTEATIAEGSNYWGKHWNQGTIWAEDGFDYMDFIAAPTEKRVRLINS